MIPPERTALLVPVKDLSQAKTRLSPLLNPEERLRLATLMLEGTLTAVAAVRGGYRRAVVTNYQPAVIYARALGMTVIAEAEQHSESRSVDFASVELERMGLGAVLRVPLDLPLIQSADLEAVLAAAKGVQAVLVPSLDRTGTNALYRSPPTLFPSHFGQGSFALHEADARLLTQEVAVLPVPNLALDIDDVADVAELVRRAAPCRALDYLRSIGIEQRLEGKPTS